MCKVDTYIDADFSGMCGHDIPTDPAYINSRNVFIIAFSDFSVLWVSKLQTDTAILTMEAKIIAMAH